MAEFSYTIEIGAPDDAAVIAAFQVAMALETENIALVPATVAQGVRHIFETPGVGFYVIAKDPKGAVVGSLLVLSEWSDWRNTDVFWVHSLYVTPEHRKRGVFRAMMEYVEALAAESGAAGIRLYVERENAAAKAVYSHIGMSNRHYEMFEKML